MNAIQRTSQSVVTQLKGLQSTAKMLIFALMVILTLSLFLVAQLAGRPSMVALPLSLDGDTRTAVLAYLEQAQVPYQERNGQLLVPADRQNTVLTQLSAREVVGVADLDFSKIMENESPFLTREQNRKRWLVTKMQVLSAQISRFSGIERATVVIDEPEKSGFGRNHLTPTATVTVWPRGEGLSPHMIEAIANAVAGAQPGMKAHDVRIIDAKSNTHHRARSAEQLAGSNHMEIKQKAELQMKAKIEDLLATIPGVVVAVNVMPDTREVEERKDNYEDPKVGPLSSDRRLLEQRSQSRGAEPGVLPNTGADIASGGASGSQLTDESSSERTEPMFPRDAQHIKDKKGNALKINATIGVPRSHFVALFRTNRNDPDAVPENAALDAIVTSEKDRIKAMVEPLIDTAPYPGAQAGTVVVSMIGDMHAQGVGMTPGLPNMVGGAAPPAGSVVAAPFDGDLLKYLLLTGLSLLSLALMFMMVRKAGVQSQLPTAEDIVGVPPPLPTDQSEIVGEAEESAPAMEGVELDEAALRHKQMLGQISDMVRQNPDEVANLLRRWIRIET